MQKNDDGCAITSRSDEYISETQLAIIICCTKLMANRAESTVPMLTLSYNPAMHPQQISLLDVNGQPVQYTLTPVYPNRAVPSPPHGNGCCICGSQAIFKCSYGISRGHACGRLLCLAHNMELSGGNGGRYPHCPEHYQHVQQNKCCLM